MMICRFDKSRDRVQGMGDRVQGIGYRVQGIGKWLVADKSSEKVRE